MTKALPSFEKRPDVTGPGSVRTEHGFVGTFDCAVFLPTSETARIWILVRGKSNSGGPLVLDWKFSCELTAGTDVVMAEEIFHSGHILWDWGGGGGVEQTLAGEITRVTVRRGDTVGSGITHTRFMITRSALLRSADVVVERNGAVMSRQVVRPGPVCRVSTDIAFRFSSAYRPGLGGQTEWGVEAQLFEPGTMQDSNRVLASLADILTLASLAERRVLLLTGWQVEYADGASLTSYRRDFTAPSDEEVDVDETLISLRSIEEFLKAGIAGLAALHQPGALKQAVQFALHGQGRGIADSYVMLFAGIETLLNLFVSDDDLAPIVPKAKWAPWFDQISGVLGGVQDFQSLPNDLRAQLLANIQGANRAYFADRFQRMCASQSIDLGDLWPMIGGPASLYAVRNRIVHGRIFSSDQEWFRAISAKFHLQWSLERAILSILRWPISRSRVSSRALCGQTLYAGWRKDRDYFARAK